MPSKLRDEITYTFPNFNGCTVEVCERISDIIPYIIIDVITSPCWRWSWSMLVKGVPVSKQSRNLKQPYLMLIVWYHGGLWHFIKKIFEKNNWALWQNLQALVHGVYTWNGMITVINIHDPFLLSGDGIRVDFVANTLQPGVSFCIRDQPWSSLWHG